MENIPENAVNPIPQAPETPVPPAPPAPPAPPVPPKAPEAPRNSPQSTGLPPLEFAPPSTFDGKTIQLIGWNILGVLLTLITLGIGAPWAQCMVIRWETKHTYVEGRQLHFDGKGVQLWGNYLLWGLLTGITLGIYALFIPVRMHKWRVKHTRFARPEDQKPGVSGGKIALIILAVFGALVLLAGAVFGIYYVTENVIREKSMQKPGSTLTGDYYFGANPGDSYQVIISGDDVIVGAEVSTEATSEENYAVSEAPGTYFDSSLTGTWVEVDIVQPEFGVVNSWSLTLGEDGSFKAVSCGHLSSSGDYNNDGYKDWSIFGNDTVTYTGNYSYDGITLTLYYGSINHATANGFVTEGYTRTDVYTTAVFDGGEALMLYKDGGTDGMLLHWQHTTLDRVICEQFYGENG